MHGVLLLRRGRSVIDHEGAVRLLIAALADVPYLPDAACRQRAELFDRAADGDKLAADQAVAICGRCPVVNQCAAWIARTHPRRPPPGVWAAHYQPPPSGKRKKERHAHDSPNRTDPQRQR
ncbi:WhiB family transcriptional regulator [[Mycobacterium] nativiensis]|uniref:WhiB family transcriptional regulator n=1 Tax=[Mycobacterium] nativiensis TaxID=2855503 RepID=UPI0038B5D440